MARRMGALCGTRRTLDRSCAPYEVRTYGCQMNVHDSERLTGLLEDAGYVAAPDRRAGRRRRVQHLRGAGERRQQALRQPRPPGAGEGAATRACRSRSAAAWRRRTASTITEKAPWVDVVFGTHNIGSLPALLERARVQEEAQVEILESLEVFPSTLPTKRESAYAAWVSISVGCNNTCTFCIVPALRGKEKDRRPGEILAEIEALVAEGVSEVTLLGQNVNAYGVEFGDRQAFSQAAARVRRHRGPGAGAVHLAAPRGVHRRRDRGDGRDAQRDAAAAHAAAVRLRPGAARRCAAPTARRSTSASSSGSAPRCRTRRSPPTSSSASPARPRRTSRRRSTSSAQARFSGAFTFQYSKRPGTPAADDARPGAARRSSRTATSGWSRWSDEIAWEENKALVGRTRRADGRRGRGPQGRRHPPALRPRPRQPAGALRPAADDRASGPATWSPSRSPTPPRTTWSPTARSSPYAAPAPATPGRPRTAAPAPAGVGARHADASAYPRRCRRARLRLSSATDPSRRRDVASQTAARRRRGEVASRPASGPSRSHPGARRP